VSTPKRARPLESIKTNRPEVIDLVSDSGSMSSSSAALDPVRKCRVGHTYFPKSESPDCPFCAGLLRKFREFASGKGGRLVSKSFQDVLEFKCHNAEHPEFSLSNKAIRSNPSLWCPTCSRSTNRAKFLPEEFSEARRNLRDHEKRRRDDLIEENKRNQAKLLSSAKQLYKLTSQPSSSSRSHHVSTPLLESIRELALRDMVTYPNLSEKQCLMVRAIISCEERPVDCWSVIAMALEFPASTEKEKLFRRAAQFVHPDKCKHPESGAAFKVLNSFITRSN